jgi:hypothetical protein
MGKNGAGNEGHKIGPMSDYFREPPPWYWLAQKNGYTGLLVAFARVCCGDARIEWRNAPVCGMVWAF